MSRLALAALFFAVPAIADDATDKLAKELRDYATAELAKVSGKDGKFSTALPDYLREQIKLANQRDREAWNRVKTKEDWEAFRDERIKALRESLGTWPDVPDNMPIRVTKTIEANGYRIDNLLYESRPGVWVDGNLYYPAKPHAKMPVILIAHSHHAPKHQGELQDMGVTWAKLGCLVLVIDQLGHGERRQHPFVDAKSYPKPFKPSRQDYYFRYNLNLQLSLVGDSLMGWMAWDLMRGLDVALARPGADRDRVILLGSVAAGGDVAAVTAALDPRFTCVVPFNFGGPQPETRYPLPEDAETWFNYAGSGSWESTRNLRDSAAKGFLPWVIVASVAPRMVIHAHEFSWDRERDPVWKRYQKVWGFFNATANLSFTTGTGVIRGNDPNASHCTNIGPVHRKGIYAALKKWFDIPVPEKESKERRSEAELHCWTPEAMKELKPKPLHVVLAATAERQNTHRRIGSDMLRAFRVTDIAYLDSHINPEPVRIPIGCDAAWINPIAQNGSRNVLRFRASHQDHSRSPVVLVICHEGPLEFVARHPRVVAILVESGCEVVLPELFGTGRSRPGDTRGRTSYSASLSATAQMLPVDTRTSGAEYLKALMTRFSDQELVVWGESLSGPNDASRQIAVPHDLGQPKLAEPWSSSVVSICSLLKPSVRAVLARGSLVSFRSVLDSPFIHVPHDALPINVFRAGDLPDVWAALAPKPLRLEGLVDGTNRRVTGERLQKALKPVADAYKKGGLVVKENYSSDAEIAKWIIEQLKK